MNYRQLKKTFKFNAKQLMEIKKGFKAKLYSTDIEIYALPEFDYLQMEQIRLGLINLNRCHDVVYKYAQPKFTWEQMEQIRLGLEQNLNVEIYAKSKFTWKQMEQIRFGLQDNLDFSKINLISFDSKQIKEIRKGLNNNLDVFLYAQKKYSGKEMLFFRRGLEMGVDFNLLILYIHANIFRDFNEFEAVAVLSFLVQNKDKLRLNNVK